MLLLLDIAGFLVTAVLALGLAVLGCGVICVLLALGLSAMELRLAGGDPSHLTRLPEPRDLLADWGIVRMETGGGQLRECSDEMIRWGSCHARRTSAMPGHPASEHQDYPS